LLVMLLLSLLVLEVGKPWGGTGGSAGGGGMGGTRGGAHRTPPWGARSRAPRTPWRPPAAVTIGAASFGV